MFTGFLLFIGAIVPRTPDGATGAAAAAIVWHVSGLSYMLSVGFGIAAATMLGQALGSGDLERGRQGVWTAARLGFACCIAVAFVSITCAGPIARFFTQDPDVGRFVFWLLVINAMFQSFDNYGVVIGEAFKGAGMTRFVMMIELPLNLLLFLGLAWYIGVHLGGGVIGAWLPLPLYAVTLGVILIIAFRRGLWKRGRA
jgi:Na+-driven multidrug efflux pump